MLFKREKIKVINTPVITVDALGISNAIKSSSSNELVELAKRLDNQYYKFRAKIPFGFVIVGKNSVIGTNDFSTFRLNDMFIVYSKKEKKDIALRYLVTSSLLYHVLLLEGFIPRGGLGFGSVIVTKDSIIGSGFVDAYVMAEERPADIKDVCAIRVSPQFISIMEKTEMLYRLLYFYRGSFFINPVALTDPDMGAFDKKKILELLHSAGANSAKTEATRKFLDEGKDYDSAKNSSAKRT